MSPSQSSRTECTYWVWPDVSPLTQCSPREREIVRGLAGFQRAGQRDVVHPRHHQHLAGAALLRHRGEQPVGVALQPRRDARSVIGSFAPRSVIAPRSLPPPSPPSPGRWSAPGSGTRWRPAQRRHLQQPRARNVPPPRHRRWRSPGTVTAPRTARSICRSKPALVPSESIELSRISPTPSSAPRVAHSIASIPVPRRPPWVVTSQPDGVGCVTVAARCGRRPTARCTATRTGGTTRPAVPGARWRRC